jgi:hypothetical protein
MPISGVGCPTESAVQLEDWKEISHGFTDHATYLPLMNADQIVRKTWNSPSKTESLCASNRARGARPPAESRLCSSALFRGEIAFFFNLMV